MEEIPPPLELHHGRGDFKHASSANIYDFNMFRFTTRENYITAMKDQEPMIDVHNRKRVIWEQDRKKLQPVKFQSVRTELMRDTSEVNALRERLGKGEGTIVRGKKKGQKQVNFEDID